MLVLTRKVGETVVIGDDVQVTGVTCGGRELTLLQGGAWQV